MRLSNTCRAIGIVVNSRIHWLNTVKRILAYHCHICEECHRKLFEAITQLVGTNIKLTRAFEVRSPGIQIDSQIGTMFINHRKYNSRGNHREVYYFSWKSQGSIHSVRLRSVFENQWLSLLSVDEAKSLGWKV